MGPNFGLNDHAQKFCKYCQYNECGIPEISEIISGISQITKFWKSLRIHLSCILCHRGVQLILAYSWARPAILVAGKGRGGMFLFLLFLHFHSCSSFFPVPLSSLRLSLLSLFSLSLGDDTKWPTRVDVSLNPNTINHYEYTPIQV